MLRSLWQYRHFVLSSIRNELISRFARSKLGGLWMIINPLAQVAIYALILSNVLAAKLPGIDNKYAYAIYLMAGLLAWTLFSETIGRCLNLFIEQGNLMKKMQFPRITLPAIVVGSNLLNNALLFIAMLGIFLLLGHNFTLAMLWLLPLTLIMTGFALGVGLVLALAHLHSDDRDDASALAVGPPPRPQPVVAPTLRGQEPEARPLRVALRPARPAALQRPLRQRDRALRPF